MDSDGDQVTQPQPMGFGFWVSLSWTVLISISRSDCTPKMGGSKSVKKKDKRRSVQ